MAATNATTTAVVTITTTQPLAYTSGVSKFRPIVEFANFLAAFAAGMHPSGTVDIQINGGSATAAAGTVTIASGSGSIAALINGVSTSVTWATSDTATATALAAAINASVSALISGVVTASSALGVVTITAVNKGTAGNTTTLSATGTGATASGARLTGGAAAAAQSLTF